MDILLIASKIGFYVLGIITFGAHLLTIVYRTIKIHDWRAKRKAKKPKTQLAILRKRLARQRKSILR